MDGQLQLFDDTIEVKPMEFVPTSTCSKCEHIAVVQFSNGNLFFCTAQKGGQYGKKIKKNAPNCKMFVESKEAELKVWDGYYGGYRDKAIKR